MDESPPPRVVEGSIEPDTKHPSPQRSGERTTWRAIPRKRKKTGFEHDGLTPSERRTQKARKPNIRKCDVHSDVPGGKVSGDRIFVRNHENGKESYTDIVGGEYRESFVVGTNGVRWGEGDGGVWVHTLRPPIDKLAWEVLKMDNDRLDELHQRNKMRIQKGKKPVLLPQGAQELLMERDFERVEKNRATLAKERAAVEFSKASDLQKIAEAKLQRLYEREHEEAVKEREAKEKACAASEHFRLIRDDALALAKTTEEKGRIVALHKENELARMAFAEKELARNLAQREQQLEEARARISRLEELAVSRTKDREDARDFAGMFSETFGCEPSKGACINTDRNVEASGFCLTMKSYVEDTSWAGCEESGYSTTWLKPAFDKYLQIRNDGC